MSSSLNDVMSNLLKISQGDVETLSRANSEFVRSITQDAKLPEEPSLEYAASAVAEATLAISNLIDPIQRSVGLMQELTARLGEISPHADAPIEAGFIPDPEGRLKAGASKYAPVLPSLGSVPQNAIAPADYGRAFWAVALDREKVQAIDASVDKIVAVRARLQALADKIDSPWYVVGIVWLLETGGSFAVHLHNGDPLTARTVHVPAGRPTTGQPPFSWEESAADAIRLNHLDHLNCADLASVLQAIERVDGLGYSNRGVSSPYLWAYTSAYAGGKFLADGTFDPNAKAAQPGTVALLRRIQEKGIVKLDTVG
jgi:lysozyme family protein